MSEEDTEICGFLDVKYLGIKRKTQKVRKRALASWKVWRRHWCSVCKLGPGLGVKVQLDCGIGNGGTASTSQRENSVIIPADSIICRAQSRSKQFAFGIFPPKERKPLLYLAGNSETETQRWMANIRQLLRPRKHRFMNGAHSVSMVDNAHSKTAGLTGLHGDLIVSRTGVFLKDAHSGEIIENFDWKELSDFHLSTVGRTEDVKRICVVHTTKEFRSGIGELQIFCHEASRLLQDLVTRGRGPRNRIRENERRPLSLSEGDLRIADSCNFVRLRANVGAFEGENFYQPEPHSLPNGAISLEDLGERARRRISDVSVGSGIYEEILEDGRMFSAEFLRKKAEPPPLPPRRVLEKGSSVNELDLASVGTRSEDSDIRAIERLETCNYVPMSPRLKDITLQQLREQSSSQENDYVIMR